MQLVSLSRVCECRLQKVIGFVSAGAVATLFLVGGFCAIPL